MKIIVFQFLFMRLRLFLWAFNWIPFISFATNVTVTTKNDLVAKMAAAKPGDTVTVKNGVYDWGQITIVNTKGKSSSAWIVMKSETMGGVVFSGSTYLQFGGTKLLVSGFKFANGNSGVNDVIQFRGGSNPTAVQANYCRLNNLTIDSYNSDSSGYSLPTPTDTKNRWVSLFGRNNRIDHCTFLNKNNGAPTIAVMYDSSNYPVGGFSTYHLIDSNYFRGRGWLGGNEGETIRVGLGSMSANDGFNVVEYNLFEDGASSDPEIISNKSNLNTYRYNTFRNYYGGVTLRQGKFCSVYGNFFLKTTPNSVASDQYGIRIIDKGHKVFNNYLEGLNANYNSNTRMQSPIVIYSGYADTKAVYVPIPRYCSADSAIVAFNTIVNCYGGPGIQIGFNADDLSPYKPQGVTVANNIIKMTKGQAILVDTALAGGMTVSYFAEGNLFKALNGLGISNKTGFVSNALNFGSLQNGVLAPPSSVKDAGVNTPKYASMLAGLDGHRIVRSSIYDVGAMELNGTGSVLASPLDSNQVGAGKPAIVLPFDLISFTVHKANGNAMLNWKTSNSLLAIDYFILEKSVLNSDFSPVLTVKANRSCNYEAIVPLEEKQSAWFRLKIFSMNGDMVCSNIVSLSSIDDIIHKMHVYPNPTFGGISILLNGTIAPEARISVQDITGKTVCSLPAKAGLNSLSDLSFPNGAYRAILMRNGTIIESIPFLVLK